MSAPRLALSCALLAVMGTCSMVVYAAGQSNGSGAKVYTWVDKNGNRHYSDQPAAPQTARRIDVRVSQARQVAEQGDKDKASSASAPADDDSRSWEQGATPDEKIAPTRDAACTVAQKNLKVLEDSSRTAYKRDASGNPVALEGEARTAEVARAQRDVDSYCKK